MKWVGLVFMVAACGGSSKAVPTPAQAMQPTGKPMDPAAALATKSEDITLIVGTRSVPGTILAPTTPGPWPAVVLLAGSGPTDRDWNSRLIPTHNGSGKLLAEHLAAHGAVVIRFDKAGSGNNPGPPLPEWTIDTYRDESLAALAALRARADVRKDRIFVLIAGWLSLRKQEREYTLGSLGRWEPPPATLRDVLDERFPPEPEQ